MGDKKPRKPQKSGARDKKAPKEEKAEKKPE